MPGCSEDLLARPRTEDASSSWAPRPPRGKSPDRRQRVPGAAAPPPAAAASRQTPPRRPRAERVSAGRALVTATDTQVARPARQQNGAHSQAIPFCRAGLPSGASHGTAHGWMVPCRCSTALRGPSKARVRRHAPSLAAACRTSGPAPRCCSHLLGFRCLLAHRII